MQVSLTRGDRNRSFPAELFSHRPKPARSWIFGPSLLAFLQRMCIVPAPPAQAPQTSSLMLLQARKTSAYHAPTYRTSVLPRGRGSSQSGLLESPGPAGRPRYGPNVRGAMLHFPNSNSCIHAHVWRVCRFFGVHCRKQLQRGALLKAAFCLSPKKTTTEKNITQTSQPPPPTDVFPVYARACLFMEEATSVAVLHVEHQRAAAPAGDPQRPPVPLGGRCRILPALPVFAARAGIPIRCAELAGFLVPLLLALIFPIASKIAAEAHKENMCNPAWIDVASGPKHWLPAFLAASRRTSFSPCVQ